jgi:putative flippase GtrA
VGTFLDFATMIACVQLGLAATLGTAIGAACGAVTNFSLGRYWIFRAKTPDRVHRQALRYGVISLGSLALNTLGEFVLHDVARVEYVVARVFVAAAVGLAWNFPLQRGWVFASVGERSRALGPPGPINRGG